MKLFIKELAVEQVEEIKKIFYKYEAKGEMLQKVIEHQEDGVNTEMFKLYSESYEEAACAYKDKFLEFTAMIPEGIELAHQIDVSVNFIHKRLEVKQMCDCDIDDTMAAAGFKRSV